MTDDVIGSSHDKSLAQKKEEALKKNPKQSCFAYEQVESLTNKFCFCFEA